MLTIRLPARTETSALTGKIVITKDARVQAITESDASRILAGYLDNKIPMLVWLKNTYNLDLRDAKDICDIITTGAIVRRN
jgi:hypothetical protein